MSEHNAINPRQFVAGASGMIMAGGLRAAATGNEPADSSKLAIHDGPKAVQHAVSREPRWGEPERERLEAMLGQGTLFYWGGPQTKLLIERFREFCPLEYVHTCSSGTAAIHIAVATAGIGLGDEVITSPITDIGTVIGLLYQGAVPVFADLMPGNANLDVEDVRRRITPKTKAIIPVHLTGNPCDMDAIMAVAQPHDLIVIEDCAQAWGARSRGQPIGTVGDFACFSLQNSKHITCGDGGVVASNDEKYGPWLQPFGDKGAGRGVRRKGGWFRAFATNYRMSEPQAAVVAGQLTRLEEIAATRARLGNLLTENIRDIPGIMPHDVHPEDRAVYWFYMFRVDPDAFRINRADFARTLRAEGVPAGGGYIGRPLYGEPVFQEHGFSAGRWPVKKFGQTEMDVSRSRSGPSLAFAYNDSLNARKRRHLLTWTVGMSAGETANAFWPGAICASFFLGTLFGQVQTKENWETKWTVGPQGKANDRADDHPIVPPVGNILASAGEKPVMVHPRTEHLQTTFVRQRIVYSEKDHIAQKWHEQIKHRQTELVSRPARGGKKPMEGRMMFLPDTASGYNHLSVMRRFAKIHPLITVTKFLKDGSVITTANG